MPRTAACPLYKLLGGGTPRLETDLTISVNSPDIMAKDTEYGINNGYNVLKTKVGIDPELDLARLRAVRGAAKDARIRIDANQAWTPKQAVRLLNQMQDAGLDIELVEQPVKANDLEGLKLVTTNSPVPVLADESVFTPRGRAAYNAGARGGHGEHKADEVRRHHKRSEDSLGG